MPHNLLIMKIIAKQFILLSIILLSQFTVSAQDHTRLEAGIYQLMEEYKAVGLAVAVVKDDAVVYSNAFGYQDREANKPLQEQHLFRIASISKSFSSTAIMQLIEAGHFTLDDDFSDLVGFPVRNPHFPAQVITLRMILSHTSSINDSQGYFNFDVINPAMNPDWEACYNNYRPGTDYEYCNLNFNMVGGVIERYSGERFDQYIKNHILDPLDLYGGYCVDSLDNSLFATLYSYHANSESFRPAPDAYHPRREELKNYKMGYSTPVFSPTGGMKISARDLASYMSMHMNYGAQAGTRIISESNSKEMQTAVLQHSQYGLALTNTDTFIPGENLVGHTGSAYGLYSNMFFHPEKKFGLVLITNGCIGRDEDEFVPFLQKSAQLLYDLVILENQK